MVTRRVEIIFRGQGRELFESLVKSSSEQQKSGKTNSKEIQLLKSIRQKLDFLRIFPEAGDRIPSRLIPPSLSVPNLFKLNLVGYYRMLYSLSCDKGDTVLFIILIVTHPEYDRIFGYRKR
jgi:hypothetical protein